MSIYLVLSFESNSVAVVFGGGPRKDGAPEKLIMELGILSGEYYPGNGSIERGLARRLARWQSEMSELTGRPSSEFQPLNIEKMELKVFGGTDMYAAGYRKGKTRYIEYDTFFGASPGGSGVTEISCGVPPDPTVGRSMCTHTWSGEPEMAMNLSAQYPIALLPQWKKIQAALHKVVMNLPRSNL